MKTSTAHSRTPSPPRKFSFYRRLAPGQRRVYDRSDAISSVSLPQPERFGPCIRDLAAALDRDDRAKVEHAAARLVHGLCTVFGVPEIRVRVLAVRPSRGSSELHGLYEADGARRAVVSVWMRTAKLRHTVAFRTFLRTIVHEFVHHLDYSLYGLADSFHTQGFYMRESSLARPLLEHATPGVRRDLSAVRRCT